MDSTPDIPRLRHRVRNCILLDHVAGQRSGRDGYLVTQVHALRSQHGLDSSMRFSLLKGVSIDVVFHKVMRTMTTAAFPLPSATVQGTIEWPYTYGVPDSQ